MSNTELLNNIIKILEKEHINLYHDISKENLQNYISSLKNFDNLSSIEFDYEMLKLFALFKDAHTSYSVPWKSIDKKMIFLNNRFYVLKNKKFIEIISINEISTSDIYNKIVPLINYETKEWLNSKINKNINNRYFFEMLGINIEQNLIITTIENENIIAKTVDIKTLQNKTQKKSYSYEIIDNDVLYFKYRSCKEDFNYPFSKFMTEIIQEIENKNIKKYILDLRDNGGGSSKILNPFQSLVKEKSLNGVLIINNGVFSGGRFAVARFKQNFNTLLIGETTGGAVKSYGNSLPLKFEGKYFSASETFFDFSNVVDYEGGFRPDIYVPTTVKDINNGNDRQLKVALKILKHNKRLPKLENEK